MTVRAEERHGSQKCILLIEDEPAVAAFLRAALERRGYRVVESPSGDDSLKELESNDFQGVISDFRMPGGMNGADVREWICKNRPELANRMVFITGDTASDETVALLARADAPWVEKPFRVHQLMAAVEKTIGRP